MHIYNILMTVYLLMNSAYSAKVNVKWEVDTLYSPSWSIFEAGSSSWYECPAGSVIGGFWKSACNGIHCIEQMKCVSPSSSPILTQTCYTKDVYSAFDNGGTFECDAGYFLRGIYSSSNSDAHCGLYCWEYFNCCKYDGLLTYDDASAAQDWWGCMDESQSGWCEIDNGEYSTGFYRSSGTNGELYLLEEAKTRRLYDECTVQDWEIPTQLITKSMDSFSSIVYTNSAYETRTTTTMSEEAKIEKESVFTHKTGLEIGVSVQFGVSGGFAGTSMSAEMGLEVTTTEEYTQEWTNTETITQSTPAEEFECPARTTCTRQRILYKAPDTQVEMTVNFNCATLGKRSVIGTYIAKGGTEIEVVDSFVPQDCAYYTSDYYDRNNGYLPHCWKCNSNISCTTCTDGTVDMDGQCYNDDVCRGCGGTVEVNESYGTLIGKYCIGHNMADSQCISYIQSDLSR